MKANEAPEKIYLTPLECMAASCQPQKDNTVEYVRTDYFVENVHLFLIDKLKEIPMGNGKMKIKADCSLEDFIEEFRNYMKGE